jgi:hypothetical protein
MGIGGGPEVLKIVDKTILFAFAKVLNQKTRKEKPKNNVRKTKNPLFFPSPFSSLSPLHIQLLSAPASPPHARCSGWV